MPGFIGIGLQELLLLAFCGAIPVVGAVVAFIVARQVARKRPPQDDGF